jgi:hypothetical protein
MSSALRSGVATSIGGLPHDDPVAAVAFVLDHQPHLPAVPELPLRSPRERMVTLAALGIDGVTANDDGSLAIDTTRLDPDAPLAWAEWPTFEAFLDAVANREGPIKLQLCGPITLGLELAMAGAPIELAFAVAGEAVRDRGRGLVRAARERAPKCELIVFLDEPGLGACGHPSFPVVRGDVVDLLSSALAAVGGDATTGVHCCSETGLNLAVEAGPQVLSLPVLAGVAEEGHVIASFLENGGWVAWGAVPTIGPLGSTAEPLWRRLALLWAELASAGCDAGLLRRQALITPACGLANHGLTQADRVLCLTTELSERARDQALATRLSVGA